MASLRLGSGQAEQHPVGPEVGKPFKQGHCFAKF